MPTQDLEFIAETSMCIWEWVLDVKEHDSPQAEWWIKNINCSGVCDTRLRIIPIASMIAIAWANADTDDFPGCYDWDFIPTLMESVKNPLNFTQDDWNKVVNKVITEFED